MKHFFSYRHWTFWAIWTLVFLAIAFDWWRV